MSKLFFDGRMDKREKTGNTGFSTKRVVKPGSADSPLSIIVTTEKRKADIEAILKENSLFANITINADDAENIIELETMLNKPKTIKLDKTPGRNDPCLCGSGKKYKKCCG